MLRLAIKPDLLRWARMRSGKDEKALVARFPRLPAWENGDVQPTWRQVQDYAHATYTPVGYLLLDEPPEEPLPIPDLRTIADRSVTRPSADLLETIYLCQQRQAWYAEYAVIQNHEPLDFVGSAATNAPEPISTVATRMRQRLGFDLAARRQTRTFDEALRMFINVLNDAGILVMVSGIVGNNSYRALNPEEFRGFALADTHAPLIFVNGNSSKSAQMFTLAHELAHIWLGQTALSDADAGHLASGNVERWCNQVAAEFLLPMEPFQRDLRVGNSPKLEAQRIALQYKISRLVVLRRMHEAGMLDHEAFWQEYEDELERLTHVRRPVTGGNFYRTVLARVGRRFASSVIVDALEGRTLLRDAMKLVGAKKVDTLLELGRQLGVGD